MWKKFFYSTSLCGINQKKTKKNHIRHANSLDTLYIMKLFAKHSLTTEATYISELEKESTPKQSEWLPLGLVVHLLGRNFLGKLRYFSGIVA